MGVGLVLAASVLWGTTGTVATFAPAVGPLAIGAATMGVGGLLLGLSSARLVLASRRVLGARKGTLVLGAAAVAIYPLAFYSSMHLAGVAVGTVVSIGSAPLAAALIERVFDGVRLTRRWMGGAGLGVAGALVLCTAGSPVSSGEAASSGRLLAGVGLGLVAGATYALYSWAAHRLMSDGIGSRAAMGAVFGAGGLLLLPVLLITGAPLLESVSTAAVGTYMALVPMFAGYLLFGWGLAKIGATMATTVSLAEPVVAAILAVLIVGERLPLAGWVGMAMILACLLILAIPERRSPLKREELTVP